MSQQNHNITYLTDIDGITIWERLRVVRNFLEDRNIALAMAVKSSDKPKDDESEFFTEQLKGNIQNAKEEIEFLTKLEKQLSITAEETRIPGKTDNEMYEINYFEELIQIRVLEVQSEIVTMGTVTPSTMKSLLKNPYALDRVIELGYVSPDVKLMLQNSGSPLGLLNKINTQVVLSELGYNKKLIENGEN